MKTTNKNKSKTMHPPIIKQRSALANCQLLIVNSKRFFLLFLFLPAVYLASGQMPGMPYGVISPDCSAVPGQPGNMTIPTSVEKGGTFDASIDEVAGANSYTWNVPAGLTIIAYGQGGNSITCAVGSVVGQEIAAGGITVYASNLCGDGISVGSPGLLVTEPVCVFVLNASLCLAPDTGQKVIYSGLNYACGGYGGGGFSDWRYPEFWEASALWAAGAMLDTPQLWTRQCNDCYITPDGSGKMPLKSALPVRCVRSL
jgi:hypothetical protein